MSKQLRQSTGKIGGLFPVPSIDHPTYCGPTAIAAATGVPVEEIERVVLKLRPTYNPQVMGQYVSGAMTKPRRRRDGSVVQAVWTFEIPLILAALGFKAELCEGPGLPTFRQWRLGRRPDGVHIVHVTGHYVTVSDTHLVDTRHRNPVPLAKAKGQRARVYRSWRITKAEAAPCV